MGKKKSCQNVRVPRPLNAIERGLYGWVEETIFTQPSVLEDSLLELRRRMSLTDNAAAEGDFILEAAGPSDRLPFQASEGDPHFLWVYQELFSRLGVHLPFTDFQKKVMTWYRVAKNNLTCRWILDNKDAVVGRFLDNLLLVEMKKTKLDRMMAMMADPTRMAPRSILPTGVPAATAAAAPAASAAPAESSANPATPSVQVPSPPPANSRAKKSSSKRERPEVVNVAGEEGAKEDPDADLRQKRER
ncbi:hypothetical protein PIB30_031067 [Stylosanthes scabra]|uniref:Uncharacterized protein n=1 Tax=Stylosanthes scabra TaxID=79078 RepID=A0ABU6SBW0_9FABA|nr:hypothetical protein [Stylosanthes scabra]